MGLLRFLLAISVVIAHSEPFHNLTLVGGPLAVETFFMISGFYISMILNQKYVGVNGSYWLFITNRFLRIFPLYWLALVLTFVVAFVVPNYNTHSYIDHTINFSKYGRDLSLSTWIIVIISNMFIFFQDVVMFLGINIKTGNLYFTHDFHKSTPPVFQFMLVQQAWSVAVEIMFYLVAPFIVRRKFRSVAFLMIGSFILKIFCAEHGFKNDPWSYRFFPFELGYFLAGTLSYFIYGKFFKKIDIPKFVGLTTYLIVGFCTVFFSKFTFKYADVAYLFMIFLSIPVLFKYSKGFTRDKFIGELSYPIYLIHLLVINTVSALNIFWHRDLLVMFSTITLGVLMVKFVSDAIEARRQNRLVLSVT